MSRAFHRLASVVTAASLAFQLSLARPASAQSDAQTVEQLANQAYEQHAAGKFAEAIATYLKAYEISKTSELLFNVATIYDRKLHERELAADYYRRYIRQPDANPDLVKRATERLSGLKREAEDEQAKHTAAAPPAAGTATPTPAAAPPTAAAAPAARDTATTPDRGWRTAGVIFGATGMAGVLASLALGVAAKNNNDAANNWCDGSNCRAQEGVDDAKRAGTFATASTITFIAGMGLFVTGVTVFFAAPSTPSASGRPSGQAPRLALRPTVGVGATGGSVALSGSF
jgi:tetratricopeptide (TPR) repeat protein